MENITLNDILTRLRNIHPKLWEFKSEVWYTQEGKSILYVPVPHIKNSLITTLNGINFILSDHHADRLIFKRYTCEIYGQGMTKRSYGGTGKENRAVGRAFREINSN